MGEQAFEIYIKNMEKVRLLRKSPYENSYAYNMRWLKLDLANFFRSVLYANLFGIFSYAMYKRGNIPFTVILGAGTVVFTVLSYKTFKTTLMDKKNMKLQKDKMSSVDKEIDEEIESFKKLYKEKR